MHCGTHTTHCDYDVMLLPVLWYAKSSQLEGLRARIVVLRHYANLETLASKKKKKGMPNFKQIKVC